MSSFPPTIRLEAVLIESENPEKLAEFYRHAFGLETPRPVGSDHLGMNLGNTYLGFDRVTGRQEDSPRTSLWFEVADIEAVFQQLVGLGAEVRYPPVASLSPGEILALLTDPEGNLIGLIAHQE